MSDLKLSRRGFFNFAKSNRGGAFAAISRDLLGTKIPRTFLRPPGALGESDFLINCTRCGKCGEVCPHHAIDFLNDEDEGIMHDTPFINVFDAPCHYCEDLPCISACEPGALVDEVDLRKMGVASFHIEHCLIAQGQYCDYCFNACPKSVKAISKDVKGLPVIDQETCVGCGKCAYICVSQSGRAIECSPV